MIVFMTPEKDDLDKPATQRQLVEVMEMIKEFAGSMMKQFNGLRGEFNDLSGEFDGLRKEVGGLRVDFESFRDEQRVFTRELGQKVDANTTAIQALDKRVRYQEDAPERLEHVETQQYDHERRITVLEKAK